MPESIALEWTLLVVAALILIHLGAPELGRLLQPHNEAIGSLGSGLAVSYVFLHLLAELDKGHDLLGEWIHFVVLLGFLLYYGLENRFAARAKKKDRENHALFAVIVATKWTYSWLLIYALPEAIQNQGWYVVPAVVAISIHVLHDDLELVERFERPYLRWGRVVLASAPLVGWLTDLFYFADKPFVSDLLTALLAGAVIYNTFSGELAGRRSRYWWFLFGVALFVVLHVMADL